MTDAGRWRWAVLASALATFDGAATHALLTTGLAAEGNALVARLIDRLGPAIGLGLRTVLVVALIAGLAALVPRSRLAQGGLALVTAVFGGVAIYHVVGSAAAVVVRAV